MNQIQIMSERLNIDQNELQSIVIKTVMPKQNVSGVCDERT